MASRSAYPARNLGPGIFETDIQFVGAGSSAPTALVGPGVASATRSGAGEYTITLTDTWASLRNAMINVIDAGTPSLWAANVDSSAVATTKVIVINIWNVTDATPPVADQIDLTTSQTLMITLRLANTGLTRLAR